MLFVFVVVAVFVNDFAECIFPFHQPAKYPIPKYRIDQGDLYMNNNVVVSRFIPDSTLSI